MTAPQSGTSGQAESTERTSGQMTLKRTHWVGDTASLEAGTTVVLSGWVQRRRDLGKLIFIDLRDRTGIVQLVFDADRATTPAAVELANALRSEYVVSVAGTVINRSPETVNPRIATGKIEVMVNEAELLNEAKTPPFYIQDNIEVDETVRLRHRYLDLRRPQMQEMLMLRHRVFRAFREFLDDHGFIEVETPILTRSTPEGARDYIVPSRLQTGEFYALPQSPQLFKQLLMVGGLERYYQIARCFRDEDLRADRQPEFSQLDIETSFLQMEELLDIMEQMFVHVFRETVGAQLARPFARLTYQEAMDRYGSDKPDTRFGMPIVDIADAVRGTGFRVFEEALASGGVVKAIVVPDCADFTRRQTDELNTFVATYGLKGVAPIAVEAESFRSPIGKFLTTEQMQGIVNATGANLGDLILIAAAPRKVALQALGALRLKLGDELGLIDENAFRFLWVVDFPLFSYDEGLDRYVPEHHPFTMPKWEDLDRLESDPGTVRAQAYDLVLNGFELSSGSMRIYRRDIQERMFAALGYTPEEAQERFGFLLNAFEYGTPPHGGIAFGLDRIVMLMGKGRSLRDCIAFPKTSSATDLMMEAPSPVSAEQLNTLRLQVRGRRG